MRSWSFSHCLVKPCRLPCSSARTWLTEKQGLPSLVLPHRASFCFPAPAFLLLLLPQRLLRMFFP